MVFFKIVGIGIMLSCNIAHALTEQDKQMLSTVQYIEEKICHAKERQLAYFSEPIHLQINNQELVLSFSPSKRAYANAVTSYNHDAQLPLDSIIKTAIKLARERDVSLAWWTYSHNYSNELETKLKNYGFKPTGPYTAMICFTDNFLLGEKNHTISDTSFTCHKIFDNASLDTWCKLVNQGIFKDDILTTMFANTIKNREYMSRTDEHYLGYYNNQAVSAGTLLINHDEKYAVIQNVVTCPEWQKKGLGEKIIRFFMQRACELGLTHVILLADAKAESIYKRIGFKKVSLIEIYCLVL